MEQLKYSSATEASPAGVEDFFTCVLFLAGVNGISSSSSSSSSSALSSSSKSARSSPSSSSAYGSSLSSEMFSKLTLSTCSALAAALPVEKQKMTCQNW
jgi:hypothetical protein